MRSVSAGLFGLIISAAAALAQPAFPPGSRIGLAPPKDMVPSSRFTGFENPAKAASISFAEMPAEAYPQLTGGLTQEALARQGITLTRRQELTLEGKPAILIAGEQSAAGTKLKKWVLALSDPGTTAFVVAQSVSEGGYADDEMEAALKSVALRAPLSIEEQLAALPFKLGATGGLRPVRAMAGSALLLTDGPLDAVKGAEQPIVLLSATQAPSPPPGEAREQFARAALSANQAVADLRIERSEPFRLKGEDWHEIIAKGTDSASGQPIVLLQTIRFGRGRLLRMVGVTRAETRDRDLPRFRAVIDGVVAD